MDLALGLVTQRFPRVGDRAATVFQQDENFRELCEEYKACTETVARLEGSPSQAEVRNEFAALMLRLEGELLRYLGAPPGR